jgi:O-succinylbenzoate synthase
MNDFEKRVFILQKKISFLNLDKNQRTLRRSFFALKNEIAILLKEALKENDYFQKTKKIKIINMMVRQLEKANAQQRP